MFICSIVGLEDETVMTKQEAYTMVRRLRKYFLKEKEFFKLGFGSIQVNNPSNVIVHEVTNNCYDVVCKTCGLGYRVFLQNGNAVAQKIRSSTYTNIPEKSMSICFPFQIRGLVKIINNKPKHCVCNDYTVTKKSELAMAFNIENKQQIAEMLSSPLYLN